MNIRKIKAYIKAVIMMNLYKLLPKILARIYLRIKLLKLWMNVIVLQMELLNRV